MKNTILIALEEKHDTKKAARIAFDQAIDAIRLSLLATGEADLPGIGRLKVIETAARAGTNPKTGEKIQIPAGKKVAFKPSKTIKDQLLPL